MATWQWYRDSSLLWLVATDFATGNRNRNRNCESRLRFGIAVSAAVGEEGTARRLDRRADHPEAGGNLRSPGNEGIRCVIFRPTRPPRAKLLIGLVQNRDSVQRMCQKREKCVKACISPWRSPKVCHLREVLSYCSGEAVASQVLAPTL